MTELDKAGLEAAQLAIAKCKAVGRTTLEDHAYEAVTAYLEATKGEEDTPQATDDDHLVERFEATMREKMARAMCRSESTDPDSRAYSMDAPMWELWLPTVDATLDAMREPDEVTLGNVGPMEGFDTDLFEHDTDRPHIDWWKAMITAIKEGGE